MPRTYCKNKCEIENYYEALKDNFKGWECHHRLETHNSDGELRRVFLTASELKSLDMYYDRPASELIYMTKLEHRKLHATQANTSGMLNYHKLNGYHRNTILSGKDHPMFKGIRYTRSDGVTKYAFEWKNEGYRLNLIRRSINTGIKHAGYNWAKAN